MVEHLPLSEILIVMMFSSLGFLGGGNGAIAIIQDRWVKSSILDPNLFAWSVAIGQIAPGPKIAFVAAIGYYLGGILGSLAALMGIIIPNTLSTAMVSFGMQRVEPWIKRISKPATFVVGGLITASAWGVAQPLQLNVYEMLAVVFVAWLVGWKKIDSLWIVVGAVTIGLVWKFI